MHAEPHALACALGGALALVMAGGVRDAVAQDAVRPAVSPRVAEAIAYEHGEGVPKDARKAADLYCEAARGGDADALFGLGWMYANGRGLTRDYDIAATLFARAAAQGHAQAAKVLPLFHQGQPHLPDCLADGPAMLEALPFDITRAEADPFADLPPYKQKIADMVAKVAPSYGIEPRFALAVISVESNFDALARSEKDARGLMQLIPETAARFRVRNPFDARDNVRGGLSYLRWLLAYYRGEVVLAAAAYNAGEAAVDRYGGVPPYVETRDYVKRVLRLFPRERHPYDPTVTAPSPVVMPVNRPRQELP
jgi:TPR repeat protein